MALLNGCGPDAVQANARLLNGPTSGVAPRRELEPAAAGPNRNYLVTADQVRATIVAVTFRNGDQSSFSPIENCTVTFERRAPSLSTLLECPFELEAGTYDHLYINYSKTFEILIDDAQLGIYTDPASPTKLSRIRPTGGAAFIPLTTTGGRPEDDFKSLFTLYLREPLVVSTGGEPPTLDILLHGLHKIPLMGDDDTIRFQFMELDPIAMFPSVSAIGKSAFYSTGGAADSVDVTQGVPAELFFFYDEQGPTSVFVTSTGGIEQCLGPGTPGGAQNISPETSPVESSGNRGGGYLGRDPSGNLCWALGTDSRWSAYASLWSMPEASVLGGTTLLTCQTSPTAPAPIAGDTYTSGCPTIATTASATLMLVGQ